MSFSLVPMGWLVQKYENMFTLPQPYIPSLGEGTYHRFAPIFLVFCFLGLCRFLLCRWVGWCRNMKICSRYPIPKSLSSGKGLTIASLQFFLCFVFWFMSFLLVLMVGCAELDALSSKILQKSDKTIVVAHCVSSSLYPVRQNLSFSWRTGPEIRA